MTARMTFFRILTMALMTTAAVLPQAVTAADVTVDAGGMTLVDHGLVGFGRIASNTKDKFGETFGSGSAMAFDAASWKLGADGTYTGTMYLLPDRGYNVEGTTDYNTRLNAVSISFMPVGAETADPNQQSVKATLADTILFTDDKGGNISGLDPESGIRAAGGTLPALPQASNGKLVLDPEGIVRMPDGSYFVSDEYGPNIYRFDATGKLLSATTPPAAFTPMRRGTANYASNNPGPGASAPDPKDPDTGRQNNQGLEGLAMTPDGKFLIAALQSATRQDGGDKGSTRDKTRALVYDLADPANLKLLHEYIVPLPTFKNGDKTAVAAASEVVALADDKFLLLARDSGNGYGVEKDTSAFRNILVVELAGATDIAGTPFDAATPVAPGGQLDAAVTPAKVTPFIDINDAAQLARFGMHNGAPNDRTNLSEKWEAMALVSVLDKAAPDDYFLFVANDNDFITQDGFQVGAAYKDKSGADVDTLIQVYRLSIPGLK